MKYFVFALFSMVLLSCKPATNSEIDLLFKAFEKQPNEVAAQNLVQKIEAQIAANPANIDENAALRQRLATVFFDKGPSEEVVRQLKLAIKDFPSAASTADNILLLSKFYRTKLGQQTLGNLIDKCFITAFPQHPESKIINARVPADFPAPSEKVREISKQIFNDSTQQFNNEIASAFVDACEIHALILNKDSLSAEYLIDAATVARNLNQVPRVLDIFKWIYTIFPNHPKAADAMFLEGFTLDSDMKELEKARTAYQNFLSRYPNDEFSDDAKVLLQNLGKSDEEILSELEKNAAK